MNRRTALGYAGLVLGVGTVLVAAPILLPSTAAEDPAPPALVVEAPASAAPESQAIVGDTVVGGTVVAAGLLAVAAFGARRTN